MIVEAILFKLGLSLFLYGVVTLFCVENIRSLTNDMIRYPTERIEINHEIQFFYLFMVFMLSLFTFVIWVVM